MGEDVLMDARNIHDVFLENQHLKELCEKYSKEIRRKDDIIKTYKNFIIEELKKEIGNDERK